MTYDIAQFDNEGVHLLNHDAYLYFNRHIEEGEIVNVLHAGIYVREMHPTPEPEIIILGELCAKCLI